MYNFDRALKSRRGSEVIVASKQIFIQRKDEYSVFEPDSTFFYLLLDKIYFYVRDRIRLFFLKKTFFKKRICRTREMWVTIKELLWRRGQHRRHGALTCFANSFESFNMTVMRVSTFAAECPILVLCLKYNYVFSSEINTRILFLSFFRTTVCVFEFFSCFSKMTCHYS